MCNCKYDAVDFTKNTCPAQSVNKTQDTRFPDLESGPLTKGT